MTTSLTAATLGLTLLAATVGTSEPTVEPRGTVRVCVDGAERAGGYTVFAEGPSGRGDQLRPGRCVGWEVKSGAYRFGLVVDPADLNHRPGRDRCSGYTPKWSLTRPGLYRTGAGFLAGNVATGEVTELRWKVSSDCDADDPYVEPSPTLPPPDPAFERTAEESRALEPAGTTGATGKLEICQQPGDDGFGGFFYISADGPSARTIQLRDARSRTCHTVAVVEGRYLVNVAGDRRFDSIPSCQLQGGQILRAGHRIRDFSELPVPTYVSAGEVTTVVVRHECVDG